MRQFFAFDAQVKAFDQPGLGAGKIREGCTADNAARTLVGDAEHDPAAALVCQGGTVLQELLEVEVLFGFLKLQVLPFW
jgi:hypothetical protein